MAERKAKALARQKAAMAQMAARQAAFRLAATDDDDDSESESDADANATGSEKTVSKNVPTGFRGTKKACAACAAGPRRRVPRASTTA